MDLPNTLDFQSALRTIATLADREATDEPLELTMLPRAFIRPGGVALLCCWLMDEVRHHGRRIAIDGAQIKIDHLVRLGLMGHLGLEHVPLAPRRPTVGRYIPLQLISSGDEVLPITNAICDLMLRHYDEARHFVPAVEWMTYEIIDNVVLHAQAKLPGAVCAQYYEASGRLEIAVVDLGRGLRNSLSEGHYVPDDATALRLAVTRGVTRNREIGQGNGVAGTQEIARINGGDFLLCSGTAMLDQRGDDEQIRGIDRMPGTAVILNLDTRRPVDLRGTHVAGRGATVDSNYLIREGERVVAEGGLRVLDECAHVAGREPARALRRKIEGILPDLEGTLVLDFGGIRMASSSFLDELLGRLATASGRDLLRARVQVANMDPLIRRMAENVIGQRLGIESS